MHATTHVVPTKPIRQQKSKRKEFEENDLTLIYFVTLYAFILA